MRGRGKIVIPVRREVCQLGVLSYEITFDIGRTNRVPTTRNSCIPLKQGPLILTLPTCGPPVEGLCTV